MKITQLFKAVAAVIFLIHFAESAPTEKPNISSRASGGVDPEKFLFLFLKYINDDLKPEQNAVFSSFNIYNDLLLLQLGASGRTRDELSVGLTTQILGDLETAILHKLWGLTLFAMQQRYSVELKIGNSIFLQKGLQLKDSYLNSIQKDYKFEPQQVDFANAGSEATDFVNNWVSSKTENRIPKFYKNQIPADTQLLVASTLLFSSPWLKPFSRSNTKNEKFNTGVKEIEVPTMNRKGKMPYMNFPEFSFEAVVLPYNNTDFVMAIVLPYRNSSVSDVIRKLLPFKRHVQQSYQKGSSDDHIPYVDIKLPRFQLSSGQSMNSYVQKFGIKKIFASDAEFDKMLVNATNVHVSDIDYAGEITVDEDGTSASSATAPGLNPASLQRTASEAIKFYVDRPFFVMVLDTVTDAFPYITAIVQNPLEA